MLRAIQLPAEGWDYFPEVTLLNREEDLVGTVDALLYNAEKQQLVLLEYKTGREYSWHTTQVTEYARLLQHMLRKPLPLRAFLVYFSADALYLEHKQVPLHALAE